jgi:hypothetical protein
MFFYTFSHFLCFFTWRFDGIARFAPAIFGSTFAPGFTNGKRENYRDYLGTLTVAGLLIFSGGKFKMEIKKRFHF